MATTGNPQEEARRMRLLVLGINYAPEFIATGLYTTGFAEHMAAQGIETHVVTARPYYPAWRTFDGWRAPWWKARRSENGTRIVHCPIYVPATPKGLRRMLHYISFVASAAPVLLWKALTRRPDVMVLIAPSLLPAPLLLAAAWLAGSKTWLHVQDFEVEAAFATGLLKEDSAGGRFALAFERRVMRRFDKVSSISRQMMDRLRQKGVPEHRITEFRNWADLKRVVPMTGTSPLKAELGITTPHVALYSGNLANKQGLEILPEMARALSHRTDLTIAVCGDGPMRAPLQEMAKDLPMLRFFPLQPVEKLNDLLGMADVHLLPQIAGAADLLLPSKLTNMLASGRPVVATADLHTALGQEVDGCGRVTPPGDARAMARAVEDLLDSPEERAVLGASARNRALERWDMGATLSRVKTQLEALAGQRVVRQAEDGEERRAREGKA
ncbi:WcaI family glycosyltransferase [Tropicibacter sp. S64]|uniref:WcaI family glycosyltransferase n=1 Tax=Tropicibacter sp. S64 TaxID=3415122 RepID=UPI003C79A8CA